MGLTIKNVASIDLSDYDKEINLLVSEDELSFEIINGGTCIFESINKEDWLRLRNFIDKNI